jgi:TolA-binding protein
VARDALIALRRRFAGSTPAKQAAFLLGRLQEDESASAALEWYGRYLEEEPDGPHASQALGRKMLLLHRQHAPDAEATARQYLQRFPNGSHAANAKRILAGR